MAAIVADIRARHRRDAAAGGLLHTPGGQFQAQEEATLHDRRCCRWCRSRMIFVVLYSRYRSAALALIIMGNIPLALIGSVVALWHRRAAAVGRLDGRLHHAGRHLGPQRHPEGQPLHQPVRSTRARRFGQRMIVRGSLERLTPVLMTALVGRARAGRRCCSARTQPGTRDPAPGGGDDLRRPDQRRPCSTPS